MIKLKISRRYQHVLIASPRLPLKIIKKRMNHWLYKYCDETAYHPKGAAKTMNILPYKLKSTNEQFSSILNVRLGVLCVINIVDTVHSELRVLEFLS